MVFGLEGMCRIYDLFWLIWIWLASHQSLSCTKSSEQTSSKGDRDECRSIRQVSPANRRGVLFKAFGKWFIYIYILGKVEDQVLSLVEHKY